MIDFSVQGARIGMRREQLPSGWSSNTEGILENGESRAYVWENRVTSITGKSLEVDGQEVFSERMPIGVGRKEIFLGLGLPVPPTLTLKGGLVPVQCFWFKQLGLGLGFQGNTVSNIYLERNFTWSDPHPQCTVSHPSSREGVLTSKIRIHPKTRLLELAERPGNLEIDGLWPGIDAEYLLSQGWSRDLSVQSHFFKEGGWAHVTDSKVRTVSGSTLTCRGGAFPLRVGMTVSPGRREVFEALGFEPVSYKQKVGYEPANHLLFEELGIEIWVARSIVSLTLREPARQFCGEQIVGVRVENDPNIRTKRYVWLEGYRPGGAPFGAKRSRAAKRARLREQR